MSRQQIEHAAGYDTDFYEWCLETAALIRDRKFDEIDWENVAEEIESMGRRDKREVHSRLKVLIMHLLKWQAQPNHKHRPSWRATIDELRSHLELVLKDSPSLRRMLDEDLPAIYPHAVRKATRETGLPSAFFPKICPFTTEQILNDDFFPE